MIDDLKDLRDKIDKVDKELLALMVARFEIVGIIADIKKANALPVFVPGREDEILDKLTSNVDPKYASFIRDIFTGILDASKRYQIEKI